MKVILSSVQTAAAAETELDPEMLVTPKMRLESLMTYLECNARNKISVDKDRRNGNNFFEHALALMAFLALCLFVAFVVWIVIFTRIKLQQEEEQLEHQQGIKETFF